MYPEWQCFLNRKPQIPSLSLPCGFQMLHFCLLCKLWTNKQKHCIVFVWQRRLARQPSLLRVIFCLPLSPECRRNRGLHCCPKQGLLWERHCVHENTGHSRGTYQDLLHRQLWQPCTDCPHTVMLSLYHSSSAPVSLVPPRHIKVKYMNKNSGIHVNVNNLLFPALEPLHCCRSRVRVWALESRLLHCGPLL